jgi:hypothetical protein
MSKRPLCYETNPVFVEASRTYSAATQLARTSSRILNDALRRHALRLLEHATAAADAPSVALRAQSLRCAKLKTLQLCGAVEALAHEGHTSPAENASLREHLFRLLSELDRALRGTPVTPADPSNASTSQPTGMVEAELRSSPAVSPDSDGENTASTLVSDPDTTVGLVPSAADDALSLAISTAAPEPEEPPDGTCSETG